MNPTPQDNTDKQIDGALSTYASEYIWASHRAEEGSMTSKDMHRKWNEADKKAKAKLKALIHQERSRAEIEIYTVCCEKLKTASRAVDHRSKELSAEIEELDNRLATLNQKEQDNER